MTILPVKFSGGAATAADTNTNAAINDITITLFSIFYSSLKKSLRFI
jgi:hypothetical protein